MKRKKLITAGILFCLLLNIKVLSVLASETTSKQEWIETALKTEGEKIVLTVGITSGSNVTSGRIAVYYPEKMIKLKEVESENLWKVEDRNMQIEQNGKKGISYAWADTKKLTEARNLFTISFELTEEVNEKEITVETEILELFSEEAKVPVKSKKLTNTIMIDFETSGESESKIDTSVPLDESINHKIDNNINQNTDDNTNNNTDNNANSNTDSNIDNNTNNSITNNINNGIADSLYTGTNTTTSNTADARVQTGDETNLAGYILLMIGAAMVIIEEGKNLYLCKK